MLFREVIGQESVKQQLIEMVEHNRLSHALLFLGKEGSGTLPLALAFASYIASLPKEGEQPPSQQEDLFGTSHMEPFSLPGSAKDADSHMENHVTFSKTRDMVHPDLHYSYPVITKKSGSPPLSSDFIAEWREFIRQYPYGNIFDWLQFIGAENKQGNITAQECNDIIRKLSLKSFESGYKILVMWMPEYLGKEGNKLLKLIEEPPPDTVFILVAENESSILSTILSRCQLVKVPAIEPADIEEALVKRSGCEPGQARLLANTSEGNYREALNLLQHADEDFHNLLKDWLNATLKNLPINQVKVIEEIARLGREKQKQFLKYFIHLIEAAIRLESGGMEMANMLERSMTPGEKDFSSRLNKAMNFAQKEALAGELDKASYYIERNANAKILFHAITIKIFYIVKNNIIVSA